MDELLTHLLRQGRGGRGGAGRQTWAVAGAQLRPGDSLKGSHKGWPIRVTPSFAAEHQQAFPLLSWSEVDAEAAKGGFSAAQVTVATQGLKSKLRLTQPEPPTPRLSADAAAPAFR